MHFAVSADWLSSVQGAARSIRKQTHESLQKRYTPRPRPVAMHRFLNRVGEKMQGQGRVRVKQLKGLGLGYTALTSISKRRGLPACCAAAPPTFSAALAAFGLTAMRNMTWSCGFGFTFVSCKYQKTTLLMFLHDYCIYKARFPVLVSNFSAGYIAAANLSCTGNVEDKACAPHSPHRPVTSQSERSPWGTVSRHRNSMVAVGNKV
jgi:hypothetical protein